MHFLTYMKRAMRAWRAEDQANAEVREWVASIRRSSHPGDMYLVGLEVKKADLRQSMSRLTAMLEAVIPEDGL